MTAVGVGSVQAGVLRGRIFAVSVGSIASLGTLVQCAAAWFKCYKCDGRQKYVTGDDVGQTQLSNLRLLINNLTTALLPQGENISSNRLHGH